MPMKNLLSASMRAGAMLLDAATRPAVADPANTVRLIVPYAPDVAHDLACGERRCRQV